MKYNQKDHETKKPIAKDKWRLKAKDPRMKNKQKLKNTKQLKVRSKEDWETQRSRKQETRKFKK